MFYLKFLKSAMKSNPVTSLFFTLTSMALIVAIFSNRQIKNFTQTKIFPKNSQYFHLVIKGQRDFGFLKSKMENLPGVDHVNIVDSNILQSKSMQVIKELEIEDSSFIKNLKFTGLSIFMNQDLNAKNIRLMREYVERIVGKNNVVTSSITSKAIGAGKSKKTYQTQISKYSNFIVISGLLIVWNIFFLLLSAQLSSMSYIVEKFQRKTNVQLKSLAILNSCLVMISTVIYYGINFKLPSVKALAITFVLLSIASVFAGKKKLKWN